MGIAGLISMTILLGACGSPEAQPISPAGHPTEMARVIEVICDPDGMTILLTKDVAVSRDGVHVRVDNKAGEPISLNGAGLDFSEGMDEQVALVPPGELKIACWPHSDHEGPEPETVAVQDTIERDFGRTTRLSVKRRRWLPVESSISPRAH
jgi:hypothetical protein